MRDRFFFLREGVAARKVREKTAEQTSTTSSEERSKAGRNELVDLFVVCIEKNSQPSRVCAREWIKTSDVAKPARRTLSTLRSTRLALFCCCGEFLPTQRTTNYYSLFVARFFLCFEGFLFVNDSDAKHFPQRFPSGTYQLACNQSLVSCVGIFYILFWSWSSLKVLLTSHDFTFSVAV